MSPPLRPCLSVPLQVERELQQQGHLYQHCVMLTFDECRRDAGVVEDVLKVFTAGGDIPLRKNHESETRYTNFAYTGKNWLMNGADIPFLPTALERSHSRRFRCTFMRNTMTHDETVVDIQKGIFLADPEAKNFCAMPAAVWSYFHDWLWPWMTQRKPMEWYHLLNAPAPDSQTQKDFC